MRRCSSCVQHVLALLFLLYCWQLECRVCPTCVPDIHHRKDIGRGERRQQDGQADGDKWDEGARRIVSISEDLFVVERGPHQIATIAYSDLTAVGGAGFSKGAKVGIGLRLP